MASDDRIELRVKDETLVPKVMAFVQSETYEQKEAILREHPELLGSDADDVLAQVEAMWAGRGEMAVAQSISAWREFLSRVAEADFEIAVLESQVVAAFVGLPETGGMAEHLSRLTALHPELLAPRAEEAILNVKAQFSGGNAAGISDRIFDAMLEAVRRQRAVKAPFAERLERARDETQSPPRRTRDLFR